MKAVSISLGINDGAAHEGYHWLPHFQWNNQSSHGITVKGLSIGWGVFMMGFGLTSAPIDKTTFAKTAPKRKIG